MGILKHAIPHETRASLTEFGKSLPQPVRAAIPSATTLVGVGLTEYAVQHYGTWPGFAALIGSRATDDIDGDQARALEVVTKFGGFLDALKDKWDIARIVPKAYQAARQIEGGHGRLRRAALGFVAAKHVLNAGLNTVAMIRGVDAKSQKWGRRNMFADSLALGAFAAADAANNQPTIQRVTEAFGYACLAVSLPMEVLAIREYWAQAQLPPAQTA